MSETLSPRESEVAQAYARGASYKAVARELGVSPATIRAHLSTIYRKLGVASKVALARTLAEAGSEPAQADDAPGVGVLPLAAAEAALQRAADQHVALLERQLGRRDAQMAELMAEKDARHAAELALLQAEMAALRAKMIIPDQALRDRADTEARIRSQLVREANGLGADRIAEAMAALGENFERADGLFEEIEARQQIEVETAARAAFARGEIAAEEVRWRDAADHFDRAARLHPTYDALLEAGDYAWRSGRHRQAVAHNEALVELATERFGPDDLLTAEAKGYLGMIYANLGRSAEAEPLLRAVLDATGAAKGHGSAAYAFRLNALAGFYIDIGRYEEGEPLARDALEIRRAVLGEDHADYGRSLMCLASLLIQTERFVEAEPMVRAALEIARQSIGEAHPDFGWHLNTLAALLDKTGRTDEALPLAERAIEIERGALGDRHARVALGLSNYAQMLRSNGQADRAEPLLREALSIRQQTYGSGHSATENTRASLAVLLGETGRLPEALPLLREAVGAMDAALRADHPMLVGYRAKLAQFEADHTEET